jgi:hypothetical protein
VECSESKHHRSLGNILKLIHDASLPLRVAERASAIFQRLGEAEARVHDVPIERVHFHEVGAVDAIIDIVGTSPGLELLGVEEIVCSSLNVGGGRVKTSTACCRCRRRRPLSCCAERPRTRAGLNTNWLRPPARPLWRPWPRSSGRNPR